jgi:hypothetical protein
MKNLAVVASSCRRQRFGVLAGFIVLLSACGSPTAPTQPPTSFGVFTAVHSAMSVDLGSSLLGECLAGLHNGSCFSATGLHAQTVIGAQAVGTPLSLVGAVNASTVTLTWSAPVLSTVTSYVIEAGSAPGLANLASFSTGNTQTTFSATGVGPGSYYVRVRAVGTAGEVGQPSNEVLVVVGSAGPCSAPGAPSGLAVVSNTSGTVSLTWSPAAGNPTSYVVEAGSAPGLTNLANSDLGSASPSLTATNVGAGTYYVRIRAKNACGTSAPSNEVVLTVGTSPSPTPIPTPTPSPRTSFGPGQYLVGRDIAYGRYYSVPSYGCYWERQSGLSGRLSDIISNDFVGYNPNQYIVDILPFDLAFLTERECGSWFNTPLRGFQSSVPPGVWLVNVQLSAGTYRANAQYGCYWERRRDFTNSLYGIIANNFIGFSGPALVSISASDVGFVSDADCGVWTRISAVTANDTAQNQRSADVERQRDLARQHNAGLRTRESTR